jgi:glucose-1-phosphate cytidylyltransferase
MSDNKMEVHKRKAEPWNVTIVDTGDDTMTGGRLARVAPFLDDEAFCFTYGDGVSDVDISASIAFHREHGKRATLTAVQPPGRYGSLLFNSSDERLIGQFQEKPEGDGAWINGGFFVLDPSVLNYIKEGDATIWERKPLEALAAEDQLAAYRHRSFWRPMDTLRDKITLEELWDKGEAPWKVW